MDGERALVYFTKKIKEDPSGSFLRRTRDNRFPGSTKERVAIDWVVSHWPTLGATRLKAPDQSSTTDIIPGTSRML